VNAQPARHKDALEETARAKWRAVPLLRDADAEEEEKKERRTRKKRERERGERRTEGKAENRKGTMGEENAGCV